MLMMTAHFMSFFRHSAGIQLKACPREQLLACVSGEMCMNYIG